MNESNPFDYSEDLEVPDPSLEQLGQISELAQEQIEAQREVERLEEELKRAKRKFLNISEHVLPELMSELGLKSITTLSGREVVVEDKVHASIPKGGETLAFRWMEENGHGSLIKRMYQLHFGRDEEQRAQEFVKELTSRENPFNVAEVRKVESSTLRSFVKKQLEKGVDLPLEAFGVHQRQVAKLK